MILTRNFILSPVAEASLKYPRIGYRNLFRDGIVTASSADPDHPVALAYDGLTYDGWRSTAGGTQWIQTQNSPAEDADYMAIAAHNLAGCELTPQSSTDGVDWTDLSYAFQPADNRPIVWEWPKAPAGYHRLLIEDAPDIVSLGVIHVGERFTLERGFPIGWSPPSLNEAVEYSNTMSEGGQILGRHITRRGVSVQGQSANVLYTWAKDEWQEFIDVAERYAFFFWRAIEDETEIMFGGLTSKGAQTTTRKHVTTSFSMEGINI